MENSNKTSANRTYEQTLALYEWNKEIANNKQGYMAVDIMSMKDFYDAGGYAFAEDYRADLGSIDAAYDRALPTFGASGERMAAAGLTGSGYSDYLSGQAYAARAAGQAAARQKAMAQSNSFHAVYNQYVAGQKEKRRQNLLTMVERAAASGIPTGVFGEVLLKQGFPKEDIEQGKELLALYITGGSSGGKYQGPYLNTGSEKAPVNGALLGANIAAGNGSGYTGDGSFTFDQLDMEDQQVAASVANSLVSSVMGYYTDDEGKVVELAPLSMEAALARLKGTYNDQGGAVTEAAVNHAKDILTKQVKNQISEGNIVTKASLEVLAKRGLFGKEGVESEAYKALLSEAQASNTSLLKEAIQQGDLYDYQAILSKFGYNAEEVTDDNAEDLLHEAITHAAKEGVITEEEQREVGILIGKKTAEQVTTQKELEGMIMAASTEGWTPQEIAEMIGPVKMEWSENEKKVVAVLESGQKIELSVNNIVSIEVPQIKEYAKEKQISNGFISVDGKLFGKTKSGEWKAAKIKISGVSDDMEVAIWNSIILALDPKRVFDTRREGASKGLGYYQQQEE